jgi:3-methyl-2-oxobutanoate hydroxymethyltransferase
MSTQIQIRRNTANTIIKAKGKEVLVVLTAYHSSIARIVDEVADIIIVGDSMGMVLFGMDSTIPVTLEMIILHASAVVKGSSKALIVVDMPFGSYQESPSQAFYNAARILKESGAQAVKLEGGTEMLETVSFLSNRGIPVMAHIGLMPQKINTLGSYRQRGKTDSEQNEILEAALAMEKAGAFSLLLEGMIPEVAATVTSSVTIPTIGIGASNACDGQVLVTEDLIGLTPTPPRFVKQYANIQDEIRRAVHSYASDVKNRNFPEY